MTAPGYVSPCCGSPVHINAMSVGPGTTAYYVCESCGQPCDPMPKEVRARLVAEGMERAAIICFRRGRVAESAAEQRGDMGKAHEAEWCFKMSDDIRRRAQRTRGAE